MTRTPEQKQALDEALKRGVNSTDPEMMRLALEKGATPDLLVESLVSRGSLDNTDVTLLTLALRKGADANLMLFAGIQEQSLTVVKIAVEQGGADVNCRRNPPGAKAASGAADWSYARYNASVVDYLISKGMDVNARNDEGATPLLRAVKDENYQKVMHYIKRGGDPMIADSEGKFPLALVQGGRSSYMSFAEKRGEMVKAMLKNLPDEPDAGAKPAEAFNANAVSTNDVIEVSRPLELKKKPEASPGNPVKGFQL